MNNDQILEYLLSLRECPCCHEKYFEKYNDIIRHSYKESNLDCYFYGLMAQINSRNNLEIYVHFSQKSNEYWIITLHEHNVSISSKGNDKVILTLDKLNIKDLFTNPASFIQRVNLLKFYE